MKAVRNAVSLLFRETNNKSLYNNHLPLIFLTDSILNCSVDILGCFAS